MGYVSKFIFAFEGHEPFDRVEVGDMVSSEDHPGRSGKVVEIYAFDQKPDLAVVAIKYSATQFDIRPVSDFNTGKLKKLIPIDYFKKYF